jgi:RNA polymerase sigma-70 factor (ECF subfamily)
VADARRGSVPAREALFRRHWPVAWRRAYAVTGRRALADDVAQDALVRAFDRLGDLEDPDRFAAWLGRIVTHRALDALRAESRLTELGSGESLAVEWVDRIGADGELQAAVAALPPERRAAIVMRYWLDLTPAEIADALELPVGTVHSRLSRGLRDLRGALEVDRA